MFTVQRFDITHEVEDTHGDQVILKDVLQKSQERAKRKYANINPGQAFLTSKGETIEEKRARKAQARVEKKERKVRQRDGLLDHQTAESSMTRNGSPEQPTLTPATATAPVTINREEMKVDNDVTEMHGHCQMMPLNPDDDSTAVLHDVPPDETSTVDETAAPISVEESKSLWGVREDIAADLLEEGICEYFPVQAAVIPVLLRHAQVHPFSPPRDICVSAPTGSGKTLAYAVPIIQVLDNAGPGFRQDPAVEVYFRRLRALVILPSRELAAQVYRVFCRLCRKRCRLRVGLAHGGLSGSGGDVQEERGQLVSMPQALSGSSGCMSGVDGTPRSRVDILVCTPGRLLEHLQGTPGFTLQHLRFLVMDEADRLLGNAYDHWVRSLVSFTSVEGDASNFLRLRDGGSASSVWRHRQRHSQLQRLLFSATLTDNPRKLSLTGVRNPLVIRTSLLPARWDTTSAANLHEPSKQAGSSGAGANPTALPATLTENVCVCKTSRRPLMLLSILAEACGIIDRTVTGQTPSYVNCCSSPEDIVLIFASSVESAHRLCRLVQIFNGQLTSTRDSNDEKSYFLGGQVLEITRLVRAEERSAALQMARLSGDGTVDKNRVKVLVASDQLARGIDLKTIRLVINYDPPVHARTYVHRVGRTARAQRTGHCISLLKIGQEGDFKKMRSMIDNNADRLMTDRKISPPLTAVIKEKYNSAIGELGSVMDSEADGTLKAGEF